MSGVPRLQGAASDSADITTDDPLDGDLLGPELVPLDPAADLAQPEVTVDLAREGAHAVDLTQPLKTDLSEPTLSETSRERTRTVLAVGIMIAAGMIVATACTSFLLALALGRDISEAREFALTVIGFVSGSLTTGMMAFYFRAHPI